MPDFDEASLRKAASWQDFKEAQSLHKLSAVVSSEETGNGWRGSVKVGKRVYRVTVEARTPTWLDTKCACPAASREGRFCPHAIAVGLHLISPPEPEPEPEKTKTTQPSDGIPEVAWKINFQGPWEKTIRNNRLSVSLSTTDQKPTEADRRITAWLISQRATSGSKIQLNLNQQNLPGFLTAISEHTDITANGNPLVVETNSQFPLEDCQLNGSSISLVPGSASLLRLGDTFWKTGDNFLSKIGEDSCPKLVGSILSELADGKTPSLSKEEFARHLGSLQSYIDFSNSDWFESLEFTCEQPVVKLTVSGSDSRLTATLSTSYSQELPSFVNNRIITDNPLAESEARQILSRHLTEKSKLVFELTGSDEVRDFLTRIIGRLPETWDLELAPGIRKISQSYVSIRPRIEIISSTDESLSFNLLFETDKGAEIPAEEIRRLLRSKNSRSSLTNGKRVDLSDDIEDLIDPLFQDLELRQEDGHFIARNASASVIREMSENLAGRTGKNDLVRSPQVIHNAPVKANLRPYQTLGFSWLVDRLNRYGGALLADDMGLGKTLQTIACIEHFFASCSQSSPALIVVPTSLLGNWQNEFERFAPSRRMITLHGTDRDNLRDQIRSTDVILTTYGTLARDLAWHLRQEYSTAVIDEASLIRNPDTDHSKAVAKLTAIRKIALTGTPVENSARDLWAIFRFIQPGWLGSRSDFKGRYEIPLKSEETRTRTASILRLKTSPFSLRRTKSEVAPELPSKIVINEFCTLSKDQLATYRGIQKEGLKRIEDIRSSGSDAAARMQALTTLLRLRQTCGDLALLDSEKLGKLPIPRRSSKLERLLEISEQAVASGSRILVFSQFRKQLLEIGKALEASEISSIQLDGSSGNRQSIVDRFQSPDGPPVFLISLKAGGYGLNLTAADVVIHFDPWWNPAAEAQATDRAHRIGQTKPVTVYRLLTRDTVEEKVVRLQSSKKALAESLDESSMPEDAPNWTAGEIEALLKS